jgi:hypothetical protein
MTRDDMIDETGRLLADRCLKEGSLQEQVLALILILLLDARAEAKSDQPTPG